MKDLILNKLEELSTNGKLDESVTKQVSGFINDIIKDTLSSWSDVNKEFKRKLNEEILAQSSKINFTSHAILISELIANELNKTVLEIAIDPIKKIISDVTESLEKREWKLSEIIAKFIESEVIPDDTYGHGEILYKLEYSSYDYKYVIFDEDAKTRSPKYRIMLNKDNKVCTPSVDSERLNAITGLNLYRFDMFIFKLYASGCTIILDEDEVETTWSTD